MWYYMDIEVFYVYAEREGDYFWCHAKLLI